MSALRLQFSASSSHIQGFSSSTGQQQERNAIDDDCEKQRRAAKVAAAAQCNCPTPYSDERAAALPQRLSTIKSEDEGQESDGERGHTQQLQQQQTLQQRLAEGKVPLVA
ncbi:uncharacterized protein EMH_0075570 [Eimeria mitis]|uniref:Uncharacterized protein n=1 Tax=Eimeria mitis TaxID=44415 RepID=U6KKY0_9EIME|nr:uncharacterized protein EMH_0075570 [Eimeria mitis]CDJ36902.1 hypothetical protein, conserved [Eimeria mitis]